MSDVSKVILICVLVFTIGVIFGFALHIMLRRMATPAGVIKIIREDDRLVYSLELQEDPAELEYMNEVVFRVESSEVSSDRE